MLLDSPILDSPFTQVTQTVFDKQYYHILVVVWYPIWITRPVCDKNNYYVLVVL